MWYSLGEGFASYGRGMTTGLVDDPTTGNVPEPRASTDIEPLPPGAALHGPFVSRKALAETPTEARASAWRASHAASATGPDSGDA